MSKLCIIPARGGSKRIPRKNIKLFLGKPIIAYSIEAALKSGLFDEVMVSTDDDEIGEVAKAHGAKVPFLRSPGNSDDYSTTVDVINEVLLCYKDQNKSFDFCCCIYPTAPFTTAERLNEGLVKLLRDDLDSVFPVVEFSSPILRSLKRADNRTSMYWPEYMSSRSQDLPKAYHDAGQWYWICVQKFDGKIWTDNTDTMILSETEVQDIDNEVDWKLAEIKYNLSKKLI